MDILEEIVAHKRIELAKQKEIVAPATLYNNVESLLSDCPPPHRSMRDSLASSASGIIAEFKRKSPSKGWIKEEGKPDVIPASYSQNVGIVTVNRVVNRFVFLVSALILMAAGFIPKLSALLTTIPQSVIGGATISVFAVIAMTGIRMFTKDGFDTRKSTIVGLSVALGAGITQVAGSLSGPGMPAWISTVFGSSSVVVSAILAIVLNLVLPEHKG